MPAPEVKTAAPGRGARRRAQTRARLLDAARQLFARQGVEATRIGEITELADVGFGSFYNHFSDKDEIVEAVLRDSTEAQGAAVEALTGDFGDPAEVVAVAHRHFVRLAREDPTWGWLLVRLDVSHRLVREALGPRALRDLQLGLKTGRFDIPDLAVTLNATGGALLGVMRAVLDGQLDEHADEHHAENVLRMLGLPRDEAAEIARRRLPTPPGG